MTHRQHMSRDKQADALSAPTISCPNCGHGIDPHGTDPGGTCGVGDENRDLCPCLLSPNAIAHLLLAKVTAERDALAASVARVRDRHNVRGRESWFAPRCRGCGEMYPCPTICALDGSGS